MNTRDHGRRRATTVTAGLTAASVAGALGISVLAQAASHHPASAGSARTSLTDSDTADPTASPTAAPSRSTATLQRKPASGTAHKKKKHRTTSTSGSASTAQQAPTTPPLTVTSGNGGGQAVTQGS